MANKTSSVSAVSIKILTCSAIHTPARSPATGHATARTMIPVVRLHKMSREKQDAFVREVRYCKASE